MANYESEHTRFIREFLKENPEEIEQQKLGRALWWDKAPLGSDERASLAKARVAQKPYYYDAN